MFCFFDLSFDNLITFFLCIGNVTALTYFIPLDPFSNLLKIIENGWFSDVFRWGIERDQYSQVFR